MKAILTVSIFALSVATASACDYQRTAQSSTDDTVVASITTEGEAQMSTPVLPLPEAAPAPTTPIAPEED